MSFSHVKKILVFWKWSFYLRVLKVMLENRNISLSQKIMGVIASNFRYVVDRTLTSIRFLRYSPPDTDLAQAVPMSSEQALVRLGVFLLGPSYSQMERMGQQIQRRLTSAFAGSQIPMPSEGVISTYLSTIQWDPKRIDFNVLVLLGSGICIRANRTISTQDADATLMPTITVAQQYGLNEIIITLIIQTDSFLVEFWDF